jgi:hypothetical protein
VITVANDRGCYNSPPLIRILVPRIKRKPERKRGIVGSSPEEMFGKFQTTGTFSIPSSGEAINAFKVYIIASVF